MNQFEIECATVAIIYRTRMVPNKATTKKNLKKAHKSKEEIANYFIVILKASS